MVIETEILRDLRISKRFLPYQSREKTMSMKLNVSIAGTGTTMILFLICSIGFAPTPSAETLFADDSESGGLEKWDVVNGEWDVIDGWKSRSTVDKRN